MIKFSSSFPWVNFRSLKNNNPIKKEREPLREFVYLDEVSLASLLASQKGEQTENVTVQSEKETLKELEGKVATSVPSVVSAEATSRFQTTNSNALQTVRKANAQSLFREFHKLEHLRRVRPVIIETPAESLVELMGSKSEGAVHKASDLNRGDLLEFRVKLSASWIYQMNTMVAEFSDMFDESPTLFMDHVNFVDLYQAKNANKIIIKLLAGLIPIEGVVSGYTVVEHDGSKYIVQDDAIRKAELVGKPLQIVGVTEHLAYWKDIRRILFADHEFTVLCRLSKSGIQNEWNPIKVADIFREFAPDLASEIEVSSKVAMMQSAEEKIEGSVEPNLMQLMFALIRYKDIVINSFAEPISDDQRREIDQVISDLKLNGSTAEGQRTAFAQVRLAIENVTHQEIDATVDLTYREQVRKAVNLPLLPDASHKKQIAATAQPSVIENKKSCLLDVEVVAIYW